MQGQRAVLEWREGDVPVSQQFDPGTVAGLVAMLLRLPNNASVAWMPVNTRLESTL